jgi:hypothetical protein
MPVGKSLCARAAPHREDRLLEPVSNPKTDTGVHSPDHPPELETFRCSEGQPTNVSATAEQTVYEQEPAVRPSVAAKALAPGSYYAV